MRIFTCPARYAPELEAAIRSAIRQIESDRKLREGGGEFAFIPNHMLDQSRSGELMVMVLEVSDKGEAEVIQPASSHELHKSVPEGSAFSLGGLVPVDSTAFGALPHRAGPQDTQQRTRR